ncbi:MAG: phosphoribosylglycinamide formyltransferase [Aureliella sp.]
MSSFPIAVLISGGGTTLKNLLEQQAAGELDVDFRLVVSSRADARGLEFANSAGIDSLTIRRRDFDNAQDHCEAVFQACRAAGVQLVVMGGYLEHLLIPDDFTNRVINIHPSLIPAFSGKGFYGQRVHSAVIDYGAKLSGCTAHFVDNEFDHGPIIAQQACEVLADDTPQSLAARVFKLECDLYPKIVAAIAAGKVSIAGRCTSMHPE